jgi:hypothetical protein
MAMYIIQPKMMFWTEIEPIEIERSIDFSNSVEI